VVWFGTRLKNRLYLREGQKSGVLGITCYSDDYVLDSCETIYFGQVDSEVVGLNWRAFTKVCIKTIWHGKPGWHKNILSVTF
jgi:hypothetical protein